MRNKLSWKLKFDRDCAVGAAAAHMPRHMFCHWIIQPRVCVSQLAMVTKWWKPLHGLVLTRKLLLLRWMSGSERRLGWRKQLVVSWYRTDIWWIGVSIADIDTFQSLKWLCLETELNLILNLMNLMWPAVCRALSAHSRHGYVAAVDYDVPQLLASGLVGQFQGVWCLQGLLETGQSGQRQWWRRLAGRGRPGTEPVKPCVANGLIGRGSRPAGGLSWLENDPANPKYE